RARPPTGSGPTAPWRSARRARAQPGAAASAAAPPHAADPGTADRTRRRSPFVILTTVRIWWRLSRKRWPRGDDGFGRLELDDGRRLAAHDPHRLATSPAAHAGPERERRRRLERAGDHRRGARWCAAGCGGDLRRAPSDVPTPADR